jgi:uncharacterized protein YqgC (DUF456 family)
MLNHHKLGADSEGGKRNLVRIADATNSFGLAGKHRSSGVPGHRPIGNNSIAQWISNSQFRSSNDEAAMNISTDGMTFKEIVLTGGALIIMAIGVAGVILPILPGLPLVWVGAFLYAHFTGYTVIDKTYLINFGLAAGGLVILEYIFKAFGAKKMGASKWGMIGAFIGMIVGISMGSLWAMILGPLVGATLF